MWDYQVNFPALKIAYPGAAQEFWFEHVQKAEPNLNAGSGSRFGGFSNRTPGSRSGFRAKGPEPEPNRTLPALV
jgi:hypothetical protein